MKRRVVITGMGAVTPIGNTLDEFWNGIKEEKVGIGAITKFDTEDYKVKIAAEVKDFNVKERLDNKAARRMEVFSQYAVAASREAFAMAGLDMEKEDPYRVGVIIGSGIGGLSSMEKEHEKIITKGPKRVSPMLIPLMISNMAAGNVAIDLGCKGKCTDVVTACATGSNSIGDALRAIQYGDADVMLAGGTESSITPVAVAGFTNLTALSSESDPLRACLPFDEARGGFVIGEGAGVVVLEELEHAKKRGAKILAELAGYGSTCDAFHITSPAEDGSGAAKAMELAMEEAGVKPEEVDYINAHGTGTHHNDLFETRAVRRAFGESADHLKMSSTKSMIGHLLGAAGAVELIVCVKSIEEGYIHPTVGTTNPGEGCDLDYVINGAVEQEVNVAISNSLGFGGHNASLLVKKYEEQTDMDYQQILELVKEVSKAGLTNFEYTEGNIRIAMSCPQPEGKIVVPASNIALQEAIGVSANSVNGANTAGTEGVAAQSQAAEAVGEKGGNLVKSPLVGTFYTAPSEDAEPFIKVGDTVKKGQTLAIVEAMKLMNEIESEFDGVVTEILVENEENVEYGQPLFRIQ